MDVLERAGLYARTARHLGAGQAAAWALNLVRRRTAPWTGAVAAPLLDALGRVAGAPSRGVLRALAESTPVMLPLDADGERRARGSLLGHFDHLGQAADLGWPVDWRFRGHGLLWLYHLSYLDELPHLAQLSEGAADAVSRLVRGWRDGCPPGAPGPWDPYPTSLRTLNLARALAVLDARDQLDAPTRALLIGEIARGACWLAGRLELHLGANHLLANLHALVVAAALLPKHPALRLLAPPLRALLRHEVEAQVLPDGGHYERSPMYHALVTAGLCELAAVVGGGQDRDGLQAHVAAAAVRAARFQETVRHPDGALPCFNDSNGREPFAPAYARAYAADRVGGEVAWPGRLVALTPSGLIVMRTPDRHLVMDCGPIGPDHQPGHAHADALSFELSVGRQRVVINAGIRGYADDPTRAWSRSTAAHSTVQIGDAEQIELWSAFRVGLRAAATLLEHEERPEAVEALGEVRWPTLPEHPVHRRRALLGEEGDLLIVDTVLGAGARSITSRLHLHPDVEARLVGDSVRLSWPDGRLLLTVAGASVRLERAPVFPDFGVTREGAVVVLEAGGDARVAVGLSEGARVEADARGARLGALRGAWS